MNALYWLIPQRARTEICFPSPSPSPSPVADANANADADADEQLSVSHLPAGDVRRMDWGEEEEEEEDEI
jgi:hypothetical protein